MHCRAVCFPASRRLSIFARILRRLTAARAYYVEVQDQLLDDNRMCRYSLDLP